MLSVFCRLWSEPWTGVTLKPFKGHFVIKGQLLAQADTLLMQPHKQHVRDGRLVLLATRLRKHTALLEAQLSQSGA